MSSSEELRFDSESDSGEEQRRGLLGVRFVESKTKETCHVEGEERYAMTNEDFRYQPSGGGSSDRISRWRCVHSDGTEKVDKDFGQFTQYSSDFALRYLKKFGFKQRLGKNESGILNPVKVMKPVVKRGGLGIGRKREEKIETPLFMRELQYNVQLLKRVYGSKMAREEKEVKEKREMVEKLMKKSKAESSALKDRKSQLVRLKEMLILLRENGLCMRNVLLFMKNVTEYVSTQVLVQLNCYDLIPSIVFPEMQRELSHSSLTHNCSLIAQYAMEWSEFMDVVQNSSGISIIERFVLQIAIPSLCPVIENLHHVDPLHDLIVSLSQTSPRVCGFLVDEYIHLKLLPMLLEYIRNSSPSNSSALHSIVFAWLPLMDTAEKVSGCPLCTEIERESHLKLVDLMEQWDHTQQYLPENLVEWKGLFKGKQLVQWVETHAVPRLGYQLDTIDFEMMREGTWILGGVMRWAAFIGLDGLVRMLKLHFFPKWFESLANLIRCNEQKEDLANWYKEWKDCFDPQVFHSEKIKIYFVWALTMIERFLNGKSMEQFELAVQLRLGEMFVVEPVSREPDKMSPTQFIAEFAAKHGILYRPYEKEGRVEGKTVYRFDKLLIYSDKDLIYVKKEGQWVPISLTSLFETTGIGFSALF